MGIQSLTASKSSGSALYIRRSWCNLPFSDCHSAVTSSGSAPGYLPGASRLKAKHILSAGVRFSVSKTATFPGHAPRNPYGLRQSTAMGSLTAPSVPDSIASSMVTPFRFGATRYAVGKCRHRIPPFLLVSSMNFYPPPKPCPAAFSCHAMPNTLPDANKSKLLPIRNFREAIHNFIVILSRYARSRIMITR